MTSATKQKVNTNSTEFEEGVEAGLNSDEDSKNWKAGNALGNELKEGDQIKTPIQKNPFKYPTTPLFLSDTGDEHEGIAQDEKDETGE
jgi:hypothetical protein